MANRQSVIDLAMSYVPSGKEVQAKRIVTLLVDSCVKSIGASFRWSWLNTRKDDYAFVPATKVYDLPADCATINRMGKLEDGLMTVKFDPIDENYVIAHYSALQGVSDIHYIPLDRDATGKKQFRLFPAVSTAMTGRLLYRRVPSANDLQFIADEMMLVYLMLASVPNEMLGGNPQADVAGKFYSLFTKQWKSAINMDEESREIDFAFEPPPRAQATNEYLNSL